MHKYILPIALSLSSLSTLAAVSDDSKASQNDNLSKSVNEKNLAQEALAYAKFKEILMEKVKLIVGDNVHIFDILPISNGSLFQVFFNDGKSLIVNKELTTGFLMRGRGKEVTVLNLKNLSDLTEKRRRAQVIAFKSMTSPFLSYKAKNETDAIDVFIDPQCTYCLKLHDEIPELNEMGITVNYYPNFVFDKNSKNANSLAIASAAFCSKDPEKAYSDYSAKIKSIMMTTSYKGVDKWVNETLIGESCDNTLGQQSDIATSLGFAGTPAIIFSDGLRYSSYLPAQKIVEYSISIQGK
jgi:thiol:disulfide interchange protein DsbC